MAELVIQPIDADFDSVKVGAAAGGDTFKTQQLVRLWVQNFHPTDVLTVTATEFRQCDHPHHGLQDRVFTIPAGFTEVLPPLNPVFLSNANRRASVGYSHTQFSGADVVFVAAMRGSE